MNDRPGLNLTVSTDPLPVEGTELHAILAVSARGLGRALGGSKPVIAEVIVIDCSGSMGLSLTGSEAVDAESTRLATAKRATGAAIDTLRDGTLFAVVGGTETARMVYPPEPHLVEVTPETRRSARDAVERLEADGGTAMGAWLRLVNDLLAGHPSAVRHAILLTDGTNVAETEAELEEVLADCEGRFVCDARGIGRSWRPEELQRIVSRLYGSADAVRTDADLVAAFREMSRVAMGKVVPDLRLRITTTPIAQLRFVKQVYPTANDLTALGRPTGERATRMSTGSWGDGEERNFHVCLDVDRGGRDLGVDLLAAKVEVASAQGGVRAGPAAICAHWSDIRPTANVMSPMVAHYVQTDELGKAVRYGYEAYALAHDSARAEAEWGRAVSLAENLGNERVLDRLRRLVDIDGDPGSRRVRLKPALSPEDLLAVAMSWIYSTRSPDPGAEPDPDPGSPGWPPRKRPVAPDRECPHCHRRHRADARFCEVSGEPIRRGA